MSAYANTPEIYAAWRTLEANRGINHHEQFLAKCTKEHEELSLLLADIKRSPSVDMLLVFSKRLFELEIFEHESLVRTLELYHCANICMGDVEDRPYAYPVRARESEEESQRRMEEFHRRDAMLAQFAIEAQRRERDPAKTKANLAAVNEMIAERRAIQQLEQGEPSVDHD